MPLIVISGFPASGKTTRAKQLRTYFEEQKGKRVHFVSENSAVPKAGYKKNEYFADSQKEKVVRSDLKSEAIRLMNKDDVIILDAGNYIKGYRYELFCASKASRGTQCTLFCGIQQERAWDLNIQRTANDELLNVASVEDSSDMDNSNVPYTREIFDALCMRYEEPHGNCRWDSPLVVAFSDDDLELENFYTMLFDSKPLPPNQSTQNAPLSSTNYLFELDRYTQQIVSDILSARKIGIYGPVPVQGSQSKVDIPMSTSAVQLNRLRRQFLNYSKMHQGTAGCLDKAPQLFVQFLNSNCNGVPASIETT